jgi:predicted transcriptional regulator
MAQTSTKDLLRETAEKLPADASVEDAMERLFFLAKIERGLEQADAGKTLSHEEVGRRLGL